MAELENPDPRPAFPPAPCFVADLVVKTPGGRRRNRCYYDAGVAPVRVQQMPTVANAIFDHFKGAYSPLMGSVCQIERVDLHWLGTGNVHYFDISTNAPVNGEIALSLMPENSGDADLLPDEVTLNIRILTGAGGRSKQGRRFISGLAEAVQSHGKLHTDFYQEAKALANKFPDTITIAVANGDDKDYAGDLTARHWDRENNSLHPIVRAHALDIVGSRRDRRAPLQFEPIP